MPAPQIRSHDFWRCIDLSVYLYVAWRLVKKFRPSHTQQYTACLHFAWRRLQRRCVWAVGAARRSCLRRGGGGRQAGATVLSCLAWRCELASRKADERPTYTHLGGMTHYIWCRGTCLPPRGPANSASTATQSR